MRRIGELASVEAAIRGKPPDEWRRIRQGQACPLLDDFGRWLRDRLLTLSLQSETAKAFNYFLNPWQAFLYYCDDGAVEIDNNILENPLRTVNLDRKNFLFTSADSDGERAAPMYSHIGTRKLGGFDPEAYLRHVLAHIANHPINRIDELSPFRCIRRQPDAATHYR